VAAALQKRLGELLPKASATGGSVSVWKPGLGYWSGSVGQQDPRFWQASVAKLLTSAVILQMVSEGRLSLDQTVDAWFPDAPNGKLATIDDLLSHTGGLFSFNADPAFRASARYWTPEELVKLSASHGAQFCPGTRFDYTNTGYVMLARIAEQIDGRPFEAIVEQRIASPLGLTSVTLLGPEADAGSLAYLARTPGSAGAPEIASITGAGNLLASTGDALALLHGWLVGDLVPPDQRATAFARVVRMYDWPLNYGRGVMVYKVPDPRRATTWLGHSGGGPGAGAVVLYDIDRDVYLAAAMNVEGPIEALANDMLKTLDDLTTQPGGLRQ